MRGGLLRSAGGRPADEAAVDEHAQVHVAGPRPLRVGRERVAVGRELERAEPEHGDRAAVVARPAVEPRRNPMRHPRRDLGADPRPALRGERRLLLVFAPLVGRELPALVGPLEVPRLDAAGRRCGTPSTPSFRTGTPTSSGRTRRCRYPSGSRSTATSRRRPTRAGTGERTAGSRARPFASPSPSRAPCRGASPGAPTRARGPPRRASTRPPLQASGSSCLVRRWWMGGRSARRS